MSHRVKNLLAIATGLTQVTGRSAKTVDDMTGEVTQRLTALGRAHDLVCPLPGEQGKAALLGDLFAILVAPYDETAAFSGRIRVAAARMEVGERTATALAMIIHELATNSVKYGALSCATEFLDVTSTSDEDMRRVGRNRRPAGRRGSGPQGQWKSPDRAQRHRAPWRTTRLRLARKRPGCDGKNASGPPGTLIGLRAGSSSLRNGRAQPVAQASDFWRGAGQAWLAVGSSGACGYRQRSLLLLLPR